MGNEMMDLEQLAAYLRRDVREVGKLASRGHLPGQKVSGQWRFARAEINHWLERELHGFDDAELIALEGGTACSVVEEEPSLASLLSEASIAVPFAATTRSSVLRELIGLAERSWHVYDPDAILEAIKTREALGSTARDNGVAIPHPRRPLPKALGESVLAYGRVSSGIPFGAPGGKLTDLFFLVCCRDDRTHLRVLARLSRLLLRPDFLDDLRAAETPSETWQVIEAAEQQLLGG